VCVCVSMIGGERW